MSTTTPISPLRRRMIEMLWGQRRRGRGTIGALLTQPMELSHA
jgi:hypothetical protein